jgi:hypothetical protein
MPEIDVEARLAKLEAKEEVREFIASYCALCAGLFANGVKFSRHHAINQVITILEPGTARHESYFITILGRGGESKIAFGRYEDLVVKQAGVWRFKDKHNDIVVNTSLEAGWAEGFGSAGAS